MERVTHKVVGAAAGTFGALKFCEEQQLNPDFLDLSIVLGAGTLGGRMADILEPANNPWHRGAAHSVLIAGLVAHGIQAISDNDRCPEWLQQNPRLRLFILSFLWGYASHLALDLMTANGLPLLNPGKGVSLYRLLPASR